MTIKENIFGKERFCHLVCRLLLLKTLFIFTLLQKISVMNLVVIEPAGLNEDPTFSFQDRRNFVRAPPPGVEFAWDFEAVQPMAQATLALDPNLEAMRFELVPKV